MSCANKFWLENLGSLFSSIQIVPLNSMSLEEQLNAMTRLILFIFVIQLLFDFKYAIPFLIISSVFIIILYYIQKRTMQRCQENYKEEQVYSMDERPSVVRENYRAPMAATPLDVTKLTEQSSVKHPYARNTKGILLDTGVPQYFCNDEVPFNFNGPDFMSKNQKLGNGHNPKTEIAPVVIAPSHALDYWKANNLITHSAINEVTQQDAYLSGYAVSTCCGNLEGKTVVPSVGCPMNTAIGGVSDMLDNYSVSRRENFQTPYGGIIAPAPADVPARAIPTLPVTNGLRYGGACPTPVNENFETLSGGMVAPAPADVPVRVIPTLPVTNGIRYGESCSTPVRENFETRTGRSNHMGQRSAAREGYNILTTQHPPKWA